MTKSRRSMDYKLFWSKESISNLEGILSYIESEWTDKELSKFNRALEKLFSVNRQQSIMN